MEIKTHQKKGEAKGRFQEKMGYKEKCEKTDRRADKSEYEKEDNNWLTALLLENSSVAASS